MAVVVRAVAGLLVTAAGVLVPATSTIQSRYDFAPVTAAQAGDLLQASTVQVVAFGCDLRRRDGTAVVIGADRLLTNRHVVDASRVVNVFPEDGPSVTAVVRVAWQGDVASVLATGLGRPALRLASRDPLPGDRVRLAGFPAQPPSAGLVVESLRVVGSVSAGQPWRVLRLSGPARQGMSGGPVLDEAGRLAGIVFGNEVQTGQALVIPASALDQLIRADAFTSAGC